MPKNKLQSDIEAHLSAIYQGGEVDNVSRLSTELIELMDLQDKEVIETIYSEYKDGNFITKYDELTKMYREDYESYVITGQ